MTAARLLLCSSLLLILSLFGCSKNPLAPAKISGSVSYKGQPVRGGTVQFVTSEGTAYSTQLGEDGTYSISDVPEGELVVTVETESLNPEKKAASGKDAEKRAKMMQQPPPEGRGGGQTKADKTAAYVKIPEKYGNPNTSPLKFVSKSGRHVHSIELE